MRLINHPKKGYPAFHVDGIIESFSVLFGSFSGLQHVAGTGSGRAELHLAGPTGIAIDSVIEAKDICFQCAGHLDQHCRDHCHCLEGKFGGVSFLQYSRLNAYLCIMKPGKVAFHTFGCKLNFAESSTIARTLVSDGFTIVDEHEQADLYIIHTCMVTAAAERKCRTAIRHLKRTNPQSQVAVIGCMAELRKEAISAMPEVDFIFDNKTKFDLDLILDHHEHSNTEDLSVFHPAHSLGDRTRSFLKIQDGCDYHCAYCTIPLVRGNSRSDTIDNILKTAEAIARSGVQETVLTGVNIGDFGRGKEDRLPDLLQALETAVTSPRIRLSSIEPDLLTDDIISLVARSEKLMPHFHIPLQAGCDAVLKRMKRRYNVKIFSSRIEKIISLMPLACTATDVITGFPGETDDEFREGIAYLRSIPVSYMHVFSYSERDLTADSAYPAKIHPSEIHRRSHLLHQLSEEKKLTFYQQNSGTRQEVLFESDNTGGFMHGFTGNYLKVRTLFNPERVNRILQVQLPSPNSDPLFEI